MKAELPRWPGEVVACLASGPSLTPEDVETVRAAGLRTIVTNTTFRAAPWADLCFGFDGRWWRTVDPKTGISYAAETARDFRGARLSMSQVAEHVGVPYARAAAGFWGFGNSGICAVTIAISAGARRVLLLGYDCSAGPGGLMHWHGAHPPGMSNCASLGKWPGHFDRLAKEARRRRVPVINCSRRTALECFDRMDLQAALALE